MFSLEDANYQFKPIKFNVDDILDDNIKPPFPNKSFFWVIVGKPGSGKTSLMLNCLSNRKKHSRVYYKVFDKIIVVMPKNSRLSIKDNIFDDLPEDQLFENFDDSVVNRVKDIRDEYTELNKKKKRNRNTLLILDDVTAYLKDNPKALIELATNRRHLKLSIILLVQFIRSVPRPVRFQVTHITFFKPSNELDLDIIQQEYLNMKKEDFSNLSRFCFVDKHDSLTIDKDSEHYFKNLQKIIM